VHKFIHHKQNLPDICASYFTENSLIYHRNIRGKSNLHVARHISSVRVWEKITHTQGSVLWNNLPDDRKSVHSTTEFKEIYGIGFILSPCPRL